MCLVYFMYVCSIVVLYNFYVIVKLFLYLFSCVFFFFKQKTAYEMRISDWSSDVCSSDLHGLVKFEPDVLDMPGLLVTDQIARAANVEVMAGKLKTRAKRVEIGKHLQPLLRRLRNQPVGGRGQISISAGLGPPHTPAKLVKLRQPKAVRPMNDKDRKSTRLTSH